MADEPETEAEAGTATEEAATETTEETDATDTPADDSADGDEDGSEADAAAAEAAGKTNVPYARFKSVNERRKMADAKVAELEAKLAALTPKEEVKPVAPKDRLKRGITPAPADMTPLEQMEHYALQTLETHPEILDAWFEKKFGMAPDAAAATLAYSKDSTQSTIRAQFEKACTERGLDPKDPNLQVMVGSAMDTKKFRTFGDAMDVFVKPKTNGSATKRQVGKGAESDGVDVTGLTRAGRSILTKDEATALAEKGQRVPQKSVVDILRESQTRA